MNNNWLKNSYPKPFTILGVLEVKKYQTYMKIFNENSQRKIYI